MKLLRFVFVLTVGVFCVGSAVAQALSAGPAEPMRIPRLTTPSPFTPLAEPQKLAHAFEIPTTSRTTIQPSRLAQNDGICYSLRSYGFRAHDLESDAPKPSSATTCTPKTAATLKGAGVVAVR